MVSPLSPRALALAQQLVRFDTVSAHSNLELIHCIRDELARLGVASIDPTSLLAVLAADPQ